MGEWRIRKECSLDRLLVLLMAFLAVSLTTDPTIAMTWVIKEDGTGDAPTIQSAIDSAASGDLIQVEPGRYLENLNTRGKQIHLFAAAGPLVTILDGSLRDSSVVVCDSGESNETVLEGFTITGGRGSIIEGSSSRLGGGILCIDSAPFIKGNIIIENAVQSGCSAGGGFGVGGTAPGVPIIFENNIIQSNYSEANAGGGWISIPCVFRGNTVINNSTLLGAGGGIYIFRHAVQVEDNLFKGNVAGDHGGAIYIDSFGIPPAQIDIGGNVIVGNAGSSGVSNCAGGAMWIAGGAYIHNNTIAFNHVNNGPVPAAGGICLLSPQLGTIVEKNILYHNQEGGLVCGLVAGIPGNALVQNNLFFENGSVDVAINTDGFQVEMIGNLFVDPMFCSTGPELSGISPALTQECGVIGALETSSCGPNIWVSVKRTSWGALKSMFFNDPALRLGRPKAN